MYTRLQRTEFYSPVCVPGMRYIWNEVLFMAECNNFTRHYVELCFSVGGCWLFVCFLCRKFALHFVCLH